MDIGCHFGFASGLDLVHAHVIGYRFDKEIGFRPDEGESWVVELQPDGIATRLSKAGWYTGLWRSEAGTVYVADAFGFVQHSTGPDAAPWRAHDLRTATLMGLWGLDDEHVYAWGLSKTEQAKPVMFRWDGKAWAPMPAPDGLTIAMHGVRPDLLFAVGDEGLIARWDGTRWNQMKAPEPVLLGSVFVVDEDEVYACGHGKRLLQGSVYGWTEILRSESPLGAVVKWREDVWVASLGDEGLCKLDGRSLATVRGHTRGMTMDARGELLVTTMDDVLSTADGVNFGAYPVYFFEDLVADSPRMWG